MISLTAHYFLATCEVAIVSLLMAGAFLVCYIGFKGSR